MAETQSMRTAAGSAIGARIDAGLRSHMNKVYGTMSVGMLVTFAVAWAVGTSPQLLSVFRDPATLSPAGASGRSRHRTTASAASTRR